MENFPTYEQVVEKEEAKIKQRHDYSIARYINLHSDAVMASVADELKQQLDKGNKYPSTKVFEIPYTIEDARALLYWGMKIFQRIFIFFLGKNLLMQVGI